MAQRKDVRRPSVKGGQSGPRRQRPDAANQEEQAPSRPQTQRPAARQGQRQTRSARPRQQTQQQAQAAHRQQVPPAQRPNAAQPYFRQTGTEQAEAAQQQSAPTGRVNVGRVPAHASVAQPEPRTSSQHVRRASVQRSANHAAVQPRAQRPQRQDPLPGAHHRSPRTVVAGQRAGRARNANDFVLAPSDYLPADTRKRGIAPIVLLIVVLGLLVALCVRQFACGGIIPPQTGESNATTTSMDVSDISAGDIATRSATFTVSAIGDCTLGTDVYFEVSSNFDTVFENEGSDTSYFLGNVRGVLETDDLSIANFEGTLSERGSRADKTYAFRGDPVYANILVDGSVEAASVANNHSRDYGTDAFEDTQMYLSEAGIDVFGYDRTAVREINGVKVGLYGGYALRSYDEARETMQTSVQELKDAGCQVIIGYFHWGIERDHTPESEAVELAHEAIDAGTDLVLGSHPHVLQGIERYNDRAIVYSLGNFCFGGNRNPSDKDTMVFQQSFTVTGGKMDASASTFDVVPCRLSSVTTRNDYRPTPLNGDEATRVLEHLNSYSGQLKGESMLFATEVDADGKAWAEQPEQPEEPAPSAGSETSSSAS